jgi:hypothetical protein
LSIRFKPMLALGLVVVACATATGVWAHGAARIVGGAHSDVLRGSAKADVLDGRGGNDKLLGLAGNDVLMGGPGRDTLVGGPGKDKLRCGSGKDVARADGTDIVAADCETVTGLPPTGEPPPTTPAPPPTQTTPPATTHALPGRYCGFTNEGKIICVTVAPNSGRVSGYSLSAVVDCGSRQLTFSFGTSGPAPIQPDLTFSRSDDATVPDRPNMKSITVSYEIGGKFDTAGNVAGTFFLKRVSFDANGSHSDCKATPTAWHAKHGA